MLEAFLKFISEHWPHLAFGVVVVVGAILITWQAAKRYFHWTHRVTKAEEECKKIDGHIMPKLNTINDSITLLSGSFNSFVIHLGAKDTSLPTSLFITKSPIQLSALGWKILEIVGGKEYVDKHVDTLIKEMDNIGVKTALDSQNIAPTVINKVSGDDSFKAIKDYMYRNPIYKEEGMPAGITVDMSVMSNIMGIYLRDKYLTKHPELNPEDIK